MAEQPQAAAAASAGATSKLEAALAAAADLKRRLESELANTRGAIKDVEREVDVRAPLRAP